MKFALPIFILIIALATGTFGQTRSVARLGERKPAPARYRINPTESRFMVEAFSGGILWFLGHDHHFAIRDFSGEAEATAGTLTPASLQMTVKAASLEETGRNFTEQQKQIINNGARKEVLEADKYPDIVFKSTDVKAKKMTENQFEAEIGGDLTLHGVTRHITIPARVMLNGDTLHASGEFSVNRSDYNVKTHSIKAGTIRVRNKVKFTFDIVANRY
ncbi:MAG TPA: YceI family protein [Blastocatellia bacterium]|nr:YceI family protein [Blastocatellia bacterium]